MATPILSPEPSCSSMQDKPFRFLDLPAELRCIVYEQIDISARHYRLKDPTFEPKYDEVAPSYMTLVVRTLPVALLATCRLVHEEAAAFLAPKLETLHDEPSNFIIDSTSFDTFTNHHESIGTMLEKQEWNEEKLEWDGTSAGRDIEAWLPNELDLGYTAFHTFFRGSNEYTAIVAFYKKCVEDRRRRFTSKTVITVRCHPACVNIAPGNLGYTTWLLNRASKGFELLLSGFEAADAKGNIEDFEWVRLRGHLEWHWRIREISEAEWEMLSARDDIVTLN